MSDLDFIVTLPSWENPDPPAGEEEYVECIWRLLPVFFYKKGNHELADEEMGKELTKIYIDNSEIMCTYLIVVIGIDYCKELGIDKRLLEKAENFNNFKEEFRKLSDKEREEIIEITQTYIMKYEYTQKIEKPAHNMNQHGVVLSIINGYGMDEVVEQMNKYNKTHDAEE